MKEIQNQRDNRNLNIQKVGVKDIKYPIIVLDKKKGIQHTIARINMYVDLPHKFKGTHMSRFIEILNQYRGKITVKNYSKILKAMQKKLKAKSAHLEVEFSYFIEKRAPVTKSKSLMEYNCKFVGSQNEKYNFYVEVQVPITTLCPCSKEMSKKGAHSQRGYVRVCFRFERFVWLEDIINIVEMSASSDVYALLKRADEKYVTDKAYSNPMFVEDIVREVANRLRKNNKISWFSVEAENLESIHNHSAYAYIASS